MARYKATSTGHLSPAAWPAWIFERRRGGFVPDDEAAITAQSRERHEARARRQRWRERHLPDMTAAEFTVAVTAERNRRNEEKESDDTEVPDLS